MTPMLIFMGVPPAVAVGTQSAQILASSVSGVLANLRRRAVDLKMGWVLVAGGVVGSVAGVALFRLLMALGQIDLFVSLAYVLFLGHDRRPDAGREPGRHAAQPPPASRRAAACTSISGCMAGRSRCAFPNRDSTSAC